MEDTRSVCCRQGPVTTSETIMPQPIRRTAVLPDFVPPIANSGMASVQEGRDGVSPRKIVKRMEIPEFKPPKVCSKPHQDVPQKVSPPKPPSPKPRRSQAMKKPQVEKAETTCKPKAAINLEKLLQDISPNENKENRDAVVLNSGEIKDEIQLMNNGKPISSITPRKRNIDVKATQEFIKEQKKKRQKITEEEKEQRKIVMEERKKKLQELREKSLQLVAASKRRKKVDKDEGTKIVDVEDDCSLGLRQCKPKRSFKESVAVIGRASANRERSASPIHNKSQANSGGKKVEVVENIVAEEVNAIPLSIPNVGVTFEIDESLPILSAPVELTVPEVEPISLETPKPNDLNLNILKLAEKLQSKIDLKVEVQSSRSGVDSARAKKRSSRKEEPVEEPYVRREKRAKHAAKSSESAESQNSSGVMVNAETIASLRKEIKEIADGFKMLQEKFLNDSPRQEKPAEVKLENRIPDWLRSIRPRPQTYNVFNAVKNKLRVGVLEIEPNLNSYISDFESSIDQPSPPVSVLCGPVCSSSAQDSGSDAPSSILDSQKFVSASEKISSRSTRSKHSKASSSIPESMASSSSNNPNLSKGTLSSYKENIVLIPPEIKVISNNLSGERLNNTVFRDPKLEEEKPINTEPAQTIKSDSTIGEIIDNLSEISEKSNKSSKQTNKKSPSGEVQARLQAELSVLDSLQQSLARIVEAERLRTVLELNKNRNEKAVNTENLNLVDSRSVQTSFAEGYNGSDKESIRTAISEEVKTEIIRSVVSDSNQTDNEVSAKSISTDEIESLNESAIDSDIDKRQLRKASQTRGEASTEKVDSSESTGGISLQMLHRMIKDEELRSEHQLALIQLRLNALIDKTKAELAVLEAKKKIVKERGGDNDRIISAIKKKQRGILLRYQTEKLEIDRLKRMHEIASEERQIIMKQQRQIQKMQVSTKSMLVKLKKDSPPKRNLAEHHDFMEKHSLANDSISSSLQSSNVSDIDLSQQSVSEGTDEILKRNKKTLQYKISRDSEKLDKCKKFLGEKEKKLQQQKHKVEEILEWENRLEVEEKRLKEMKKRAINFGSGTSHHHGNHSSPVNHGKKHSKLVEDRSTSPLQQHDIILVDSKSSETVSNDKSKVSSLSSIPEILTARTSSGEIPEELSKVSTARSDYSESFESSSEAKSVSTAEKSPKLPASHRNAAAPSSPGIVIKAPLSPRTNVRKRYSSGSDDSANLSFTETPSEQSDVEGRITALNEQLRSRKLEAERLRREQKRKCRERLRAKEESLQKQIQAYDSYIDKLKKNLETELDLLSPLVTKPLIKQPKAERKPIVKEVKKAADGRKSTGHVRSKLFKDKESIHEQLTDSKSVEIGPVHEEKSDISESIDEQLDNSAPVSLSVEEDLEGEESHLEKPVEESHDEASVSESIGASIRSAERSASYAGKSESIPDDTDNEDSPSLSENITSVSVKTTVPSNSKHETSEIATAADSVNLVNASSEEKVSTEVVTTIESEKVSEAKTPSKPESDIKSEVENVTAASAVSDEVLSECETICETEKNSLRVSKDSSEKEIPTKEQISDSYTEIKSETSTGNIQENLSSNKSSASEVPENVEYAADASFVDDKTPKEAASLHDNGVSLVEEVPKDYSSDSFESVSEAEEGEKIPETGSSEFFEIIDDELKEEVTSANEKVVDAVTDSIFSNLLNDSLSLGVNVTTSAKIHNTERITEELAHEAVEDSLDKMIRIYMMKSFLEEDLSYDSDDEPISPERVTSEIRKRIHEIMAASVPQSSIHDQNQLKTTFDVSPSIDQRSDGIAVGDDHDQFTPHTSPTRKEVAVRTSQDLDGQQWFDDYYGLSKTRKEAQQLELQQLQIEQEIEQLKAQHVPYYFLREIPNKPPPPYTPPGKAATTEKSSLPPSSEEDVTQYVRDCTKSILAAVRSGQEAEKIEPGAEMTKNHFTHFLWDLAKELVVEITSDNSKEVEKECLPWEKVPPPLSICRSALRPKLEEDITRAVLQRANIILGYAPWFAQESRIVKWSLKKREHVDKLLIWESQEEEAGWTRYDEEVLEVKNSVTTCLLESLLQDAADVMDTIFKKKTKCES